MLLLFVFIFFSVLISQSLCEDTLCPLSIPNGYIITAGCSRHYGTNCYDYSCDYDYVKHSPAIVLKCNYSGQWQWEESEGQPCVREKLCPSTIRNGNIILDDCTRRKGVYCTYKCDPGCTPNPQAKVWLRCDRNGRWSEDTDLLCTDCSTVTETVKTTVASLCPATIHRGRIASTCDRRPYSSCNYTCDTGCTRRASELTCQSESYWSISSDACSCSESDTRSYTSSVSIVGVVVTIVGVLVIVGTVVRARNRRRRKSIPTQSAVSQCSEYQTNVTGRPATSGMPVGLTSPTYGRNSSNYGFMSHNYANPSQDIYYSSLQPQQNYDGSTYAQIQPPLGNKTFEAEPPAYSSIAPVLATEDPPSYEQVTSNPVEFKV